MKNIDIVRRDKKNSSKKVEKPFYSVPKYSKKPKTLTKNSKKHIGLGLFFSLKYAFKSIFNPDIFLLSFIRNIFSLRTLFFSILAFVYFSVSYVAVLKPDELLSSLKSFLSPSNTFQFVGIGLIVLFLITISWLMDSIILPTIYRYEYQKIDLRPIKSIRVFLEITRNIGSIVFNKLNKLIVFIPSLIMATLFVYALYILGYGSLKLQISLFIFALIIIFIGFFIYTKFRYYMQVSSAIALNSDQKKFLISFRQSHFKPIRSTLQSIIWAFVLFVFICLSLAVVYVEISILNNSYSMASNILILSASTTIIYLIWSVWTSFQAGYWTGILNYERSVTKLHFSADQESGYLGFWVLIIILLIIFAFYFALSFAYSAQLSEFLVNIWDKLPDTIKINLPKPN